MKRTFTALVFARRYMLNNAECTLAIYFPVAGDIFNPSTPNANQTRVNQNAIMLDHGQLVRFSFFVDPEVPVKRNLKTKNPEKRWVLENHVPFGHGCEFSAGNQVTSFPDKPS